MIWTLLAIAQAWSILLTGASEDGGVSAQRRAVQLQLADYRPTSQHKPTADEIRAAFIEALSVQKIVVTSNAKTHVWLELTQPEKRDGEGIKACARVTSWIVEVGKEYLPKQQVATERCVLNSQPKVPADRNVNWIGVADAFSRSSRRDAIAEAYAQALGDVIANLKRTLDR